MLQYAILVIACLALTACGGASKDGDPYSGTGSAQASGATAPGTYRVVAGDTLYAVARKTEVPLRALIEANGLQPPYLLKTGQLLTVPSLATYAVKSGDTLFSLSRRFGVEMSELAKANGIQEPYVIKSGEVLVIPNRAVETQTASGSAPPAAAPAVTTTALAPQTTTGSGGTTTQPQTATPSATGTAPVATAPAAQTTPSTAPAATAPAATAPAATAPPAATPAPAESQPTTPQPASAAPKPVVLPDPPARAGSKFIWPVDGTLLSTFGPKEGGLHNDGINIAAPKGAPIKAADNGVVAYVGDGLRGFGNLILIKHQGDYVTAYAHADQILVKRGQIVRRGETIGRVGSTGAVESPQLHFEIRKGSRAIDPLTVMISQTASR